MVDLAEAFVEQGLEHPLLRPTANLLPVDSLDLTVHEPVWTTTVSASALLGVVKAMRAAEGGTGYWLGMLGYGDARREGSGVAEIGGWVAYSEPDPHTIAHEIGHMMDLSHAPCGGAAGSDPWFPDPVARIGSWGYDRAHGLLVSPNNPDHMSYCEPQWVGEYGFSRAIAFRIREEVDQPDAEAAPQRQSTLLLWGGVDGQGELYLRPSVLLDAVADVPPPGGDYSVSGRTADGPAFSLSFDMLPLPDLPEERLFVITLPVTWSGALESIRFDAGDRAAILDRGVVDPMTILRDPTTGQVRAVLERRSSEALGRLPGVPLEVFESQGIPTP